MIYWLLFFFGLLSLRHIKTAILFSFPLFFLFDIIAGYVDTNLINLKYVYASILLIRLSLRGKLELTKSYVFYILYLIGIFIVYFFSPFYKPIMVQLFLIICLIPYFYFVGEKLSKSFKEFMPYVNYSIVLSLLIIFGWLVLLQFVELPLAVMDSSYSRYFVAHHFDYGIYFVVFSGLYFLTTVLNKESLVRSRRFNIIILVLCYVLVLIFMKRWAIFGLVLATLYISYFASVHISKAVIIKLGLTFLLVISVLFFVFGDLFEKQLEVREDRLRTDVIQEEGRWIDYLLVYEHFTINATAKQLLFGDEYLFDSTTLWLKYFDTPRVIHSDMAFLPYTIGVSGFFLYLLLLLSIRSRVYSEHAMDFNSILARSIFLIVVFNLIAGGTVREFTSASFAFFLMGYFRRTGIRPPLNE